MSKKKSDSPPKLKQKKYSCKKCGAVSDKKSDICKPAR